MSEQNKLGQIVGDQVLNWQPMRKPANDKLLIGRYCILEPLDATQHTTELFTALTRESTGEEWTYLNEGPFKSLVEFTLWLKEFATVKEHFSYVVKIDKVILGLISYVHMSAERGELQIRRHFSNLLKRTPATTEAAYLMMRQAFEALGCRRYVARTNAFNKASINSSMRLGFVYEGTFRQHHVIKGRNVDTVWLSIIDKEWPHIKFALEEWLKPENFDENGKQKVKLQIFRK